MSLKVPVKRMNLSGARWAYAVFVLCAIMAMSLAGQTPAHAQTFTTLHSFEGTDGSNPVGALIQASNGNLYGTTSNGGAYGEGTVFSITTDGTLATLYSFCSQLNCADGANPDATLLQASDGNLYGTTSGGGAYYGNGTIFEITPSGTLTTFHSFDGDDGMDPVARLIQATNGALYGTTEQGGNNPNGGTVGSVFEITLEGTLTSLFTFNYYDGRDPAAGLIQAANGNLYGTTNSGGGLGRGTVYEITTGGSLTTLYTFCSETTAYPACTDGAFPVGGLIQARNGNLYGTTSSGGADVNTGKGNYGYGTVFELSRNGTLTTLHIFDGYDGIAPEAGLIQASDGNLYGTTSDNGPRGHGTVFAIAPSGKFKGLHAFDGADGSNPADGLVQASNGNLYGTTSSGGANGDGTVFEISPSPLPAQ